MHHEITAGHGGGNSKAPKWPSYKGKSLLAGTSSNGLVTVYVDPTLGAPAQQNVRDLISDADRVVAANDALFGTTGGPVNVVVFALGGETDGTGGADHMGCDYTTGADIEVCASFGNPSRVSALFEAELSECSMNGQLCGLSTGEALSRWCAAIIGNNALSDFATAPQWVNDGMPDFVNQTDPTDHSADSTGCGMAFLSWLISLGYGLDKIAQAMVSLGDSGTLAQLYAGLTANPASQAWPAFQSAIQALPNGVTSDDPFGGLSRALHLAHLSPVTVALAGSVFAAILGDIGAGKTPEQMVKSVRAALAAAPVTGVSGTAVAACRIGSRRLRPKVDAAELLWKPKSGPSRTGPLPRCKHAYPAAAGIDSCRMTTTVVGGGGGGL